MTVVWYNGVRLEAPSGPGVQEWLLRCAQLLSESLDEVVTELVVYGCAKR
jgi:hypothetical protein